MTLKLTMFVVSQPINKLQIAHVTQYCCIACARWLPLCETAILKKLSIACFMPYKCATKHRILLIFVMLSTFFLRLFDRTKEYEKLAFSLTTFRFLGLKILKRVPVFNFVSHETGSGFKYFCSRHVPILNYNQCMYLHGRKYNFCLPGMVKHSLNSLSLHLFKVQLKIKK